jgi:hypothetical protein
MLRFAKKKERGKGSKGAKFPVRVRSGSVTIKIYRSRNSILRSPIDRLCKNLGENFMNDPRPLKSSEPLVYALEFVTKLFMIQPHCG